MWKIQLVICGLLLLSTLRGYSQGKLALRDTTQWTSSEYVDLLSKQKILSNCEFIFYGKNQIDWIQNNGSAIYRLPIRKTHGKMKDFDKEEFLRFEVELEGELGEVKIARQKNVIKLIFDFRKLKGGPIYNEYLVSAVKSR